MYSISFYFMLFNETVSIEDPSPLTLLPSTGLTHVSSYPPRLHLCR